MMNLISKVISHTIHFSKHMHDRHIPIMLNHGLIGSKEPKIRMERQNSLIDKISSNQRICFNEDRLIPMIPSYLQSKYNTHKICCHNRAISQHPAKIQDALTLIIPQNTTIACQSS